jgi:hypothetical protein
MDRRFLLTSVVGVLTAPLAAEASAAEIFLKLIARRVPVRELSNHAPINHMSGTWGLRG